MSKRGWADRVDWSKPDTEIAADVGVTRQRVHQVRQGRSIPSVEDQRREEHEALLAEWLVDHKPEHYTRVEVREQTDLPAHFLAQSTLPFRARGRSKTTKYDWDSITLEEWATTNNSDLAERLGVRSVSSVREYRARNNLPANPQPAAARIAWDRITSVEWLTMTNAEIAELLGASRPVVAAHRRRHNLPGTRRKQAENDSE